MATSGSIQISQVEVEVQQGAVSPAINSVAPTGSKFFYDSTTNKITRANEGGLWVKISVDENIIDFSVNADPNTVGTTFSPNQPTDPDVTYHSTIDDTLWIWNGTVYVPSTAPKHHFFTNSVNITAFPADTVVTHNLNSSSVDVQVRDAAGFDTSVRVIAYSANSVTLRSSGLLSAPRIFISKIG